MNSAKKYIIGLILAIVLVCSITFQANRGTLEVLNESGRSIGPVTITVDGVEISNMMTVKDGQSLTAAFGANKVKTIEIELELGDSGVSRGSISPGPFASIHAKINDKGNVVFNSTRFEHSSIKIGSW